MDKILSQKIKIAKLVVGILQYIPFIRMVALCNSITKGDVNQDSDIDFFIVTEHKYIFTVRYMAVFLITILGLKSRPDKGICKDKICLSFFLSNFSLNLDRLNRNKEEEVLRANWISNLVPVFDESNTYLDFVDKNSWVKKYDKNYYTKMASKTKNIKVSTFAFIIRKIIETISFFLIGWIVENIVRNIQINRLLRFKHSHFGEERMVINDQIIKLHYKVKKESCELY